MAVRAHLDRLEEASPGSGQLLARVRALAEEFGMEEICRILAP